MTPAAKVVVELLCSDSHPARMVGAGLQERRYGCKLL